MSQGSSINKAIIKDYHMHIHHDKYVQSLKHGILTSNHVIMHVHINIHDLPHYITIPMHECMFMFYAYLCHYQSIDPNHSSNNPRMWKMLEVDWKKGASIAKPNRRLARWEAIDCRTRQMMAPLVLLKKFTNYIWTYTIASLSSPNHTSHWVIKTVI